MLSRKKLAAVMVALFAVEHKKKVKKAKRCWSRWRPNQDAFFSDVQLLPELRDNNPDDFRHLLGMTDECYDYLLAHVGPLIQKKDTLMRNAVTAEQRLVVTLRYLATGRKLEDLKSSSGISAQCLGAVIPETCQAIINVLKEKYMKFPNEEEDWLRVAQAFDDIWNFPNCGGCIDGRHVRIVAPHVMGSFFYNNQGYNSIVLVAIVDANYEFIMVDVGGNGGMSDGGVLENTAFYRKLMSDDLNLPTNNETTSGLNFTFVADDAFSLHKHILKSYPKEILNSDSKKIYNYRVWRAKRCVENAFGIMASRFRIFQTPFTLSLWKIDLVVMACCMLHNFLIRDAKEFYTPPGSIDTEDFQTRAVVPGEWRNNEVAYFGLENTQETISTNEAKQNRESYEQYFNNTGALSWQNNMIL